VARASISVSDDGFRWSPPVSTDSFPRNRTEKRVIFKTPVRARYVRLTALEGFAGQGFASVAEFSVIGAGEN
jgi:beta-galactosidase